MLKMVVGVAHLVALAFARRGRVIIETTQINEHPSVAAANGVD
jgi:hypothetical protein